MFQQVGSILSSSNQNKDDVEGVHARLLRTQTLLIDLNVLYGENRLDQLRIFVNELVLELSSKTDDAQSLKVVKRTSAGTGKGAPKFDIPVDIMNYYVENGFKATQISKMLHVSLSTIKRRLKDYNLSKGETFTKMTDELLDKCIDNILIEFPNTGYKKMKGYLLSKGIIVQERRVREAMRRVDPEGVILRCLQSRPVLRRKYCVAGPLSLWHMDGNHKLVR